MRLRTANRRRRRAQRYARPWLAFTVPGYHNDRWLHSTLPPVVMWFDEVGDVSQEAFTELENYRRVMTHFRTFSREEFENTYPTQHTA